MMGTVAVVPWQVDYTKDFFDILKGIFQATIKILPTFRGKFNLVIVYAPIAKL